MAVRNRQPIDLLIVKGKKNLTKDEIDTRRKQEMKAPSDKAEQPRHLTSAQRGEFEAIAAQRLEVNIITTFDYEIVSRYIKESL